MSRNAPTPVQLEIPRPVKGKKVAEREDQGDTSSQGGGGKADLGADLDADSDGNLNTLKDLEVRWGFDLKEFNMSKYCSTL